MMLLVKLILAHMIGDFLLQPGHWVKKKEKEKLKAPELYIHALLHGLLPLLFVGDLKFWFPAAVIAVTHFIIDAAKLYLQGEKGNRQAQEKRWPLSKRTWFFIDQALHVAVIAIVWYNWQGFSLKPGLFFTQEHLIFLTAVVAVTLPASVVVKTFISKWTPHTEESEGESLDSAGEYIGIFERLFVLSFVITGHWEAIGFLIAAKSVFRFGDLKESKDRKLTEYILIGTLLSFGIAFVAGMLVHRLQAV
jgi:hypothetical protein